MVAAGVVCQGYPAAAQETGFEDVQDGQIWTQCEQYFLHVDKLRQDGRHYLIRDASKEFGEGYQALQPRTKKEALLYYECINLARGNMVHSIEQIKKQDAADDDFLDMARIDATNNSNASQFEYMSEIDGKYDMKGDMDMAQATYDDMMRQAQEKAMQRIMMVVGSAAVIGLSIAGSQESSNFSSTGSGYNGGGSNFSQLAQTLTKILQQNAAGGGASGGTIQTASSSQVTIAGSGGSGAAPKSTNAGSSWTPPPPTPVPNNAQGGSTVPGAATENRNAPATAGEDSVVLAEPVQGAAATVASLPSAPKLNDSCARYEITRVDVGFADVTNTCDKPISFIWCWLPAGGNGCEPSLLSNIVAPGGTTEIAGPAKNQQQVANVVVCDMSNPEAICER